MNLFEVQVNNFLDLLKKEFGHILDMAYTSNRYYFDYEEERDVISVNLSSIDYFVSAICTESRKYLKKNKKGLCNFYSYLSFINRISHEVFQEIVEELEETGEVELLDTGFFYDVAESIFNFQLYLKEINEITLSCEEYYDTLKNIKVKSEIEKLSSFVFIDNYNGLYLKNKKEIYDNLLEIIATEKFKEKDEGLDNLEKKLRKSFNKEFLNWIYVEDKTPIDGEIYITIDEFNEEVEAIYLNKKFVYLSSDDVVSDVIAYKNV